MFRCLLNRIMPMTQKQLTLALATAESSILKTKSKQYENALHACYFYVLQLPTDRNVSQISKYTFARLFFC